MFRRNCLKRGKLLLKHAQVLAVYEFKVVRHQISTSLFLAVHEVKFFNGLNINDDHRSIQCTFDRQDTTLNEAHKETSKSIQVRFPLCQVLGG